MRKRKGIKWPKAGSPCSKYRVVFKQLGLPKLSGKYVLDDIPKVIRDRYRKQLRRESLHRVIDHKIYPYKFYPWSYKDGEPSLILQGWYDVKLAKRRYIRRYGNTALDHIKFIQGKEAVERGFKISQSLYINGKWRVIMNKTLRPMAKHKIVSDEINKDMLEHTQGRGKFMERKMLNTLNRQEYGISTRSYIPEVTYKKRVILQKLQKTNQKRSRDIYEKPSPPGL